MEKNNRLDRLQEIAIFIGTVFLSGIASFLYGETIYETVRIVLLTVVVTGCVLIVIETSRGQKLFLFEEEDNFSRFVILYFLFLIASVLLPMLPQSGWPYPVIYISFMLFSNRLVGMCAGSCLLMITTMLSAGESVSLFIIYFVGGMVGIVLFSSLNESFKVGLPLLISLLMQFLGLCIMEVLVVNESLHIHMLIVPVGNIVACLFLLLIILKYFSYTIIYKTRDLYTDINDPECPLLVKLKEHSKEEYYHAIHTAYLCDRIAKRLQFDDAIAKAGGYYHKIGILKGESNWENTDEVLEEYCYPEPVRRILKEYLDRDEKIILKETVTLLISDTVISSIKYLLLKDPEVHIDYEKLISAIFKKKEESGLFNYSQISFGELEEMKKILLEEKLYYDFLR